MAGKPKYDWPPDEQLVTDILGAGTVVAYAKARGLAAATVYSHLDRQNIREQVQERLRAANRPEVVNEDPEAQLRRDIHARVKRKKRIAVADLADDLDVSPRRIREALERLRADGYRVPEEKGEVVLESVAPDKLNLHRSLLEGEQLTVGLVSDTHLSSNEQALDHLELAYDVFADRGITEVWHSGDWTCGVGIFPTQHSEIFNHTFESQVDYLEANYPSRPGIVTRGISGNHDIEGQFGRVGANPVIALANRRDDVEFLGDYSAWIELPNGAWVHLLHGKGGMSYAYSYKAQKLVDGYPSGRKPAILAPGHWHVSGWIEQRAVNVIWPGCFEWKSKFLERLGLTPAVGFWILNLTLGDDGSLVRLVPEWHRFYEGRAVAA
jgi:predicted phosphodiesterase